MGTTADYIFLVPWEGHVGLQITPGALLSSLGATQVPSAVGSHPQVAGAHVSLAVAREHCLPALFVPHVSLRPWPGPLSSDAEEGSGGPCIPLTGSSTSITYPHLPSYLNRVPQSPL